MTGTKTTSRAGGRRPGSGPKALFRPKPWMHSVQLTPHASTLLDLRATEAGMNRGDYLNALVLFYAETLDMGVKPGFTYWPNKDPRPRTFRFTPEAHQRLLRLARRLDASEGDVIEGLIRGGFQVSVDMATPATS